MVAWQHHLPGDSAEEWGAGLTALGEEVLGNLGRREADGQDLTKRSHPSPKH